MKSRLWARVALGYLALIAIVITIQAVLFVWLVDRQVVINALEQNQKMAAQLASALEANRDLDLDRAVAALHPTEAVFVIMKDGRVSTRRKAIPDSIVATVTGQFRNPISDSVIRGWVTSQYRGVPVVVDGEVVAALGTVPLTTIERHAGAITAIGAALLLAGAIIASVLIVGPVRSRLQELQRAAARLGGGDFRTRAAVDGVDEVAELAQAFNSMADELERRTAALEASDRARRQLVADVSHELMTPLTAILGHLETLTMPEVRLDDEQRLRQVAITTREAKRLERVIGDLLDVARLEAGGGDLNIQTIDTRDLFDQVMAHHEHDSRTRGITFIASIDPAAATLEADPFRLEQALENITANAIRHTSDGGVIRLSAERQGQNIVLAVTDQGEGIAPEHLPHIFDRFYKTSSAKGRASRGSGLGLSIVKAVVARHGGRVSAASSLGDGTTIRIELPSPVLNGRAEIAAAS